MRYVVLIPVVIFLIGNLGCQNASKATSGTADKTYDVVAVVVAMDTEKNTVTLDIS